MKKRFIISLASTTKAQNDVLLNVIKSKGLGYWRWLGDTWYVTDTHDAFMRASLVDTVMQTHPGVRCVGTGICEGGSDWSGFGPNTETRDMFKWLITNWK